MSFESDRSCRCARANAVSMAIFQPAQLLLITPNAGLDRCTRVRAQQLGATAMTFSVILLENDKPKKVIGTIWANEETQASALARDLCKSEEGPIAVRK